MPILATKSFPVVAGVLVSGAVAVSCVVLVATVLLVRRPLLATWIRGLVARLEGVLGSVLERGPRSSRLIRAVPPHAVPQAPPGLPSPVPARVEPRPRGAHDRERR